MYSLYSYRMDGDKYVLADGGDVVWSGEEVAIAFSYEPNEPIPGTLHKHGSPAKVNEWASQITARYSEAGLPDMAYAVVVISGKIPLEDLNRMIDTAGYVGIWYRKQLEEGTYGIKKTH